jgi:hypothetical protein
MFAFICTRPDHGINGDYEVSVLTRLIKNEKERLGNRFKFQKRRQLFICMHNETLLIAAMRVSNRDRSPLRIKG